jgi:hypothetical protein
MFAEFRQVLRDKPAERGDVGQRGVLVLGGDLGEKLCSSTAAWALSRSQSTGRARRGMRRARTPTITALDGQGVGVDGRVQV